MEAARIDPACDGYDFWTIVDVIVKQGDTYSAQGLFNPFWEVKKNGATEEDFNLFNGPTVLLLKTEPQCRVVVAGDEVNADFWISYYGESDLVKSKVEWVLRSGTDDLAQGTCDGGDVEIGSTRLLGQVVVNIPVVKKPVHAVLEAKIQNTESNIRNCWDFWIFPKREKEDGHGLAVSPELMPALEKLYTGLLETGKPGSESAGLIISRIGSPDVAKALAAGKKVILINQAVGKANVSLGWWSMGNQVGTAFARHPALGDLPHEGYLSPLMFRILKQGKSLPFARMVPEEIFIAGEGLSGFFLYAGEARVGAGRVLMAFGLDLLSGYPEGTCILDGLIHYAKSDGFNPKGEVIFVSARQNGWKKTIKTGDRGKDNLISGAVQIDVARAMKDKNELVWETEPVPEDLQNKKDYAISWLGGMGYFAQPQGSFTLYVNGEKTIYIASISEKDAEWFNADKTASLKYKRDINTDECGSFTLILPSSKVKPGQPLILRVVGSESNSRRWFGVFQME